MKAVLDLIITLSLLLGGATITKKIYEEVRELSTSKIKQGLSSSEKFSNAITGRRLSY